MRNDCNRHSHRSSIKKLLENGTSKEKTIRNKKR